MSTFVAVNTYVYSVRFVADNLLRSMKEIVRGSGLDPNKLATSWSVLEAGISTWLSTKHLKVVTLEVFDPADDELVGRWDLEIAYEWSEGAGGFWVDTDQIRYFIQKQGIWPGDCEYRVVVKNKPGRPDVPGWSSTTYRSTDGLVRQSIGTTLDASGLGAAATYYRKR